MPGDGSLTTQQRRAVATGVITLLIGSALISVAGAARAAVVWRPEFDAHLQADTSWKREQRELSLEILCELNPSSRKCR